MAKLGRSGFGAGDIAWPGDPASGQASPAATVTACAPSGGTPEPLVGDGADGVGDRAEDRVDDADGGAGGADPADGDPPAGFTGAELTGLAGPAVAAELLGCVLAAVACEPDGTIRDVLRWLEQPAPVVATTTATTAITDRDVVRTRYPLCPPPGRLHLAARTPDIHSERAFIVNRRLRPRES